MLGKPGKNDSSSRIWDLSVAWEAFLSQNPTLWGFIFRWMVWRENRCS